MANPLFCFGSFGSGINMIINTVTQYSNMQSSKSLKLDSYRVNLGESFDDIHDVLSFIESHKKLYPSDVPDDLRVDYFVVKGQRLVGYMDLIMETYADLPVIFCKRPLDECFDNYNKNGHMEPIESSAIQQQIDLVNAKVEALGLTWTLVESKDNDFLDSELNIVNPQEEGTTLRNPQYVAVYKPS